MIAFLILLAAQQTDCYSVGHVLHCSTTPAPGSNAPIDYGKALQAGRDLVQPYRAPSASEIAAWRSARNHRHAGELIAKGKCGEAEAFALKQGDLDLAADVKAYCSK